MINIKELSKYYGTTKAVDNISFEIKRKEVLGFLGPNGAGKTTTVRVITCFLAPTSGTVEIDGLNVFDHSLEIRRKIGYLPENTPLYSDMNVVDFLRYTAELRKISSDKRSARIKKMIEVCGLGEALHKNIGQLSKGYNQRVGLAQAMLHDPEIIILDEPTSGLDPNQIVEIRNVIRELGREKTVVLCTHILSEVQASCDRALIINKGKIAAHGTIDEISASSAGGDKIYIELRAEEGDPLAAFKDVEGVEEVAVVPGAGETKAFRLGLARGVDSRERIFRAAVENNWAILEMRRDRTSLEEVFRQLTAE